MDAAVAVIVSLEPAVDAVQKAADFGAAQIVPPGDSFAGSAAAREVLVALRADEALVRATHRIDTSARGAREPGCE